MSLNIYQRMHAVMKAVSYVQKEEKKVNNQYTFVSHDAVTAKLRPALIEAGIVTVPRVVKHAQDGNRTEVDIEVDFVNVEKPDDKVTIPMFGFGIDPSDKGPGKAISYAVKYALLKAFSLETGDDPERDNIPHQKDVADKIIAANVSPNGGLWDALEPDMQIFLADLAMECKAMIKDGEIKEALAEIARHELDTDQKAALNTRFDSKERSAMKKYIASLKQTEAPIGV